jgi:integrase
MSRKNENKKGANGAGSIRKIATTRNGKEYTYWQGRYTEGYDACTGKQIQRSITGKTQKEVAQKLRQITAEIDAKTYVAPCKLSVAEWMAVWAQDYLVGIKASTAYLYKRTIELYIEPHLGHIRLDTLNAHTVQHFYNELAKPSKPEVAPLSAKSIKNIHGVLHKALKQAVLTGYLRTNPSEACILPRIIRKEMRPLEEDQVAVFLREVQGHPHEYLYKIALFTGLREGELLGLMWDCVDFEKGTILVNKQLRRSQRKGGTYYFSPPKNNKSRTITPAPYVMKLLQAQKVQQAEQRLMAGPAWEASGLVFTNEFGRYVSYRAIFDSFKRIVKRIGLPDARIHDLRHTYAVNCIRAGDDIKTVQSNLGHATAAFTLDVYGHFTDDMRSVSAQRMEGFITNVLNL